MMSISSDALIAGLGLVGALILSLISVGVLFGKLFQRVDTLEKDLNAMFAEIRKLKEEKKK